MDTYLQVFLTAIISFAALISVLGVIFNWLLSPVKENQVLLKNEIKEVSDKQRSMEREILRIDQKQTEIQDTLTKIYNRLFAENQPPSPR